MTSHNFTTATHLLDLLEHAGLSITDVADHLDVSRTTIHNWKRNDADESSPPTPDQLAALATLASSHLAAHLDRLLATLQSDAVLLSTRRHLAHGVRPTLHQGARRLEAIRRAEHDQSNQQDQEKPDRQKDADVLGFDIPFV